MADFTEVMMQAHRMCAMLKRCEECPGWDVKESFCRISCVALSDFYVLEQNVLTWAKEHPEPVYPSWAEGWKQLFPDAAHTPCPEIHFGFKCDKDNEKYCFACKHYAPMPAEFAEKLGIMPKEVMNDAEVH